MSAADRDWTAQGAQLDGGAYKWGLNAETGEFTVWAVGGPGDGFPSHQDALAEAWGRQANFDSGDVLGTVIVTDATVAIVNYGTGDEQERHAEASAVVVGWARATFPNRRVVVDGTPE